MSVNKLWENTWVQFMLHSARLYRIGHQLSLALLALVITPWQLVWFAVSREPLNTPPVPRPPSPVCRGTPHRCRGSPALPTTKSEASPPVHHRALITHHGRPHPPPDQSPRAGELPPHRCPQHPAPAFRPAVRLRPVEPDLPPLLRVRSTVRSAQEAARTAAVQDRPPGRARIPRAERPRRQRCSRAKGLLSLRGHRGSRQRVLRAWIDLLAE